MYLKSWRLRVTSDVNADGARSRDECNDGVVMCRVADVDAVQLHTTAQNRQNSVCV